MDLFRWSGLVVATALGTAMNVVLESAHGFDRIGHARIGQGCQDCPPTRHPKLLRKVGTSAPQSVANGQTLQEVESDAAMILGHSQPTRAASLRIQSASGALTLGSGAGRWSSVEYGALTLHLTLPTWADPLESRVLIDGQPAHPEFFHAATPWELNELDWYRSISWPCPPLGRHAIQLEVMRADGEVDISPALLVDIVPPHKPEVIAAGNGLLGLKSVQLGQIVTVSRDGVTARFAGPATSQMVLVVEGVGEFAGIGQGDCCFYFDLRPHLSVGRHALRFRRVVGDQCSLSSELSDVLWIQWEPAQGLASIRNENAQRRFELAQTIRRQATTTLLASPTQSLAAELHRIALMGQPLVSPPAAPPVYQPFLGGSGVGNPSAPTPAPTPSQGSSRPGQPHAPRGATKPEEGEQPETILEVELPESAAPAVVSPTDGRPVYFRSALSGNRQAANPSTYFPVVEAWGQYYGRAEPLAQLSQLREAELSQFEDHLAAAESSWRAEKMVSHVVFDAPAYFTKKGYGVSAQEDARFGLVLLEGMELKSYANGRWELHAPYIPPVSPAKLFLQIQFKTADGRWKPLTLQPICLKASPPCQETGKCNGGNCTEGKSSTLIRTGQSPILRREVGFFTEVRRKGAVEFGHGYAGLEDRRRF